MSGAGAGQFEPVQIDVRCIYTLEWTLSSYHNAGIVRCLSFVGGKIVVDWELNYTFQRVGCWVGLLLTDITPFRSTVWICFTFC